ncbi:MAG TPA: hypothetical protein VFB96_20015 [Pirellulaceae bacterium]|jgi:hypothetical protein|nr:hypothetical protein [Pirellulaceae bacterium]
MNNEFDPLEAELGALRPVEPSGELAERIGKRLHAERSSVPRKRANGTRSVPTTYYWFALAAVAAALLVAVAIWRGRERTPEVEMPLASPPPLLAFDDALPSVWTYRSALASPAALDQLLDKHARLAPPPGDNEQTRGFGAVTMNQNSHLGGL